MVTNARERLRLLWAGEVSLPEAFWHYAVFYGLILNVVTTVLFLVVAAVTSTPWLLVPVYLLPAPYNVLMIVAVWRSADRYQGPRQWADLARFGILAGMLILTMT